MADGAVLVWDTNVCAMCCIACTGAVWNFCLQRPYGASSSRVPCGGTRGCCGSCLQGNFDDDEFDRDEPERRERKRDKNAKKTEPRTKGRALNAENHAEDKSRHQVEVGQSVSETHAGRVEDNSDPPGSSEVIAQQPGPKPSMEL